MGQPQSSEHGNGPQAREVVGGGGRLRSMATGSKESEEEVPYTKYSRSIPDPKPPPSSSSMKGITVVNPKPDAGMKMYKPMELQKLDRMTRFWPILKSTVEEGHSHEKIAEGLNYHQLLIMCSRYQKHLTECSSTIGTEQKALASRLRDLEMFSAGVAQQMIRRQDMLSRALSHIKKVNEVAATLERMTTSLQHCLPLLYRLNNLLPDEHRLEPFRLQNPDQPARREIQPVAAQEEEEDEEERSVGGALRTEPRIVTLRRV